MKSCLAIGVAGILLSPLAGAAPLSTLTVRAQPASERYAATGTIEAVRQGTLGSQVSGRVIKVLVRNGDAVRAGQPLIQIDAGESADAVAASDAAARGAAARLVSARADFARTQRLQAQDYLSAAALQRAAAALASAEAEAQVTAAQAQGARTRAAWHTVTAPYSGHVTDLWVSAGDLATPGMPLVALYDPAALRVIAQLPESLAARVQSDQAAQLVVADAAPIVIASWRVIAAIDPATHSVEVRAELPEGSGLKPGQFARLQLPLRDSAKQLQIPSSALLRRSEVTAVYVVDANGAAHLRQLRLGPVSGNSVTVLAGLQAGEQIALDPVAAGKP